MILAMCQQHQRQIQRQRHTQRQIQRQRQERTSKKKSSCICIAYFLHIIHTLPESQGHCLSFCDDNNNDKDTHKDKYRDKDEDNDKDKVLKSPITCYIFEKLGVQGYQIRRLQ